MHPTRALAALALTATLLAACGGEPQIPELTDPTEILAVAAATTSEATSVHIDATADGELSLGLGGATAPFDLEGSTATADVDIAAGEGRATFALPGILGLRGEVIVVDGIAYAKTSLTGEQYVALPLGGGAAPPVDPSASPIANSILAEVMQALALPELQPTKGADADCGTTSCYTVTIELTADEIATLLGGDVGLDPGIPGGVPIPLPDLASIDGIDATVLVEKGSGRLAGLQLVVATGGGTGAGAGTAAEATIDMRFSKWGEGVTVEAPPADEVQSAN